MDGFGLSSEPGPYRDRTHIVPIQLNTLMPVGTAIIMVVNVKTEFATGPRPTVNM